MDVRGDFLGVGAGAFLIGILGHRLGDEAGQLRDGAIADERVRVFLVGALPLRPVAGGTMAAINLLARESLGCGRAGESADCPKARLQPDHRG